MYPVKRHPGQRIGRRHLHPQHPVQLPPTLLPQRRVQRGGVRVERGQQIDGAEQLPQRDAAAGHVLAVIASVVPAAGDIEVALAAPSRVEPFSVRARPARHLCVAAVREQPDVPGRAGVAGGHVVRHRHSGPQQCQYPQGVQPQLPVRHIADPERVARVRTDIEPEAFAAIWGGREVEDM
jgi:hypothetical protein